MSRNNSCDFAIDLGSKICVNPRTWVTSRVTGKRLWNFSNGVGRFLIIIILFRYYSSYIVSSIVLGLALYASVIIVLSFCAH